jgi:replicative DNA helicase
MGKTTLYGQMAINCAVRESQALMFSLEMPATRSWKSWLVRSPALTRAFLHASHG